MYNRIQTTLLIILLTALFSGCGSNDGKPLPGDLVNNPNTASGKPDPDGLPVITFSETQHDFGKIIEGESVSIEFAFTNTGKSDLIIAEVTSSCGCTIPSYSKIPIRPGEKGTIKVAFNSTGRKGYQSKNVIVVSNTQPNTTLLTIKAQVVNA